MNHSKQKIDYAILVPTILLIGAIAAGLMFRPVLARQIIQHVYDGIVGRFGWMYMVACLASFLLLAWITFSGTGNFRLGGEDAKPAYNEFEWASMLFTSGVGSSAVILGFMEPLYYLESPPYGIEPFTTEAYEYAHMYGQFHWGPSAWAFYIPAIVAVGLIVFNKNEPALRLSVVNKYLSRTRAGHFLGKVLDVIVQFGIVAGISTSMGLAVPVISLLLSQTFHIPNNMLLKVGIICIWICIFSFSVFRGLDKGIRILSNFNMVLLLIFGGAVLIFSGVNDVFKMEVNSIGLYFQNFLRLNTWLDPFGEGEFQKMWTIFYWGWWLTFMPLMALFTVRVSRGRTLRHVVWMQLIWGSLGCWGCFMIFGGHSLKLQNTGALDLVATLNQSGQDKAVVQILQSLPAAPLMAVLFCVLIFVFLATTIDSAAYVLASSSVRNLQVSEQPSRSYRVFWAAVLAVLSIALLVIDQLKAVQTLSLIAGLPLIFVQLYLCWAAYRLLKDNKNKTGVFKESSRTMAVSPAVKELDAKHSQEKSA